MGMTLCARLMPPHCSTELLLRVCKSPFLIPQLEMQVSELHPELINLRGGVFIELNFVTRAGW